jgi:hypothetical protein
MLTFAAAVAILAAKQRDRLALVLSEVTTLILAVSVPIITLLRVVMGRTPPRRHRCAKVAR